MTPEEIQTLINGISNAFKDSLAQANNSILNQIKGHFQDAPSKETSIFMAEQKQLNETIDDKLDDIILKVDTISKEMLCKTDASEKYATKNELVVVKGKMNFYAWIVPVLTGLLGAMITYIVFR